MLLIPGWLWGCRLGSSRPIPSWVWFPSFCPTHPDPCLRETSGEGAGGEARPHRARALVCALKRGFGGSWIILAVCYSAAWRMNPCTSGPLEHMYGVAPVNGIGVLTPFVFLLAPVRRGGPCCQTTRPESGVVVRLCPLPWQGLTYSADAPCGASVATDGIKVPNIRRTASESAAGPQLVAVRLGRGRFALLACMHRLVVSDRTFVRTWSVQRRGRGYCWYLEKT